MKTIVTNLAKLFIIIITLTLMINGCTNDNKAELQKENEKLRQRIANLEQNQIRNTSVQTNTKSNDEELRPPDILDDLKSDKFVIKNDNDKYILANATFRDGVKQIIESNLPPGSKVSEFHNLVNDFIKVCTSLVDLEVYYKVESWHEGDDGIFIATCDNGTLWPSKGNPNYFKLKGSKKYNKTFLQFKLDEETVLNIKEGDILTAKGALGIYGLSVGGYGPIERISMWPKFLRGVPLTFIDFNTEETRNALLNIDLDYRIEGDANLTIRYHPYIYGKLIWNSKRIINCTDIALDLNNSWRCLYYYKNNDQYPQLIN
ncbi:MAG: hypothetical protein JW763_01315 [candidate division Zixibacteria bacterium]|nr:hypothetical protein [candidate division Zixibacteria bacterium]